MSKLILFILIISLSFTAISCGASGNATEKQTPLEKLVNELLDNSTNPQYVYENGAIHVGGDGKPIELANNTNADNPTFAELIEFIKQDTTNEHIYRDGFGSDSYVCSDYAKDVHNNAERAGIKAAWVSIYFKNEEIGHACNAFQTVDKGLVYVDCTGGNVGGVEYPREILELSSPDSTSNSSQAQSLSWDNIAYIEIGNEYGLIYLDSAQSLSYEFYKKYKLKLQEYENLLNKHNTEVTQYNQEIIANGLYEDSPEQLRIEAWEAELESKKQLIDNLSEEYDSLLQDYENEVIKYNHEIEGKTYNEDSSELAAVDVWEARLEETEQMLDEISQKYTLLSTKYNDEISQYNKQINEMGFLEGSPEGVRFEEWEKTLKKDALVLNDLVEELGEFWSKPLGIVEDIQVHW